MISYPCGAFAALKAGHLPPERSIYPAEDCLICHSNPCIARAADDGTLRSLFVDPELWERDIHKKKGFVCTTCHVDACPDSHKIKGFASVSCEGCHPEEAEEAAGDVHGIAKSLGARGTPACQDCHTSHAVLPPDDPQASTNISNISRVCIRCHPRESARPGFMKRLATWRISGHGKDDLTNRYDPEECTECHFRQAIHYEGLVVPGDCDKCHRLGAKRGKIVLAAFHIRETFGEDPMVVISSYIWAALIFSSIILALTFFGLSIRRKKKG